MQESPHIAINTPNTIENTFIDKTPPDSVIFLTAQEISVQLFSDKCFQIMEINKIHLFFRSPDTRLSLSTIFILDKIPRFGEIYNNYADFAQKIHVYTFLFIPEKSQFIP